MRMQCKAIYQFVDGEISKEKFEDHMKECSLCKQMHTNLDDAFSILELSADVPENMAEKIIRKKNDLPKITSLKRDLSMILQIACVVIAGIFLGIVLGKNSNTQLIMGKSSERTKSLIEYRDSHHFTVNPNFFK